jgi:ABC-type transporter Mla maintaining outer membrane lipid asymmetry ATPase subunit MlaF
LANKKKEISNLASIKNNIFAMKLAWDISRSNVVHALILSVLGYFEWVLEAAVNKTVVFISHRLSTTHLADKIFMLENGEIIEAGSHDKLLKMNGKYAEMWRVQAGQYIKENVYRIRPDSVI